MYSPIMLNFTKPSRKQQIINVKMKNLKKDRISSYAHFIICSSKKDQIALVKLILSTKDMQRAQPLHPLQINLLDALASLDFKLSVSQ